MEDTALWHVFVDDETGQRSCCYGFKDALTFNQKGEFRTLGQGKTEIPMEEWTEKELCRMMSGCLTESKMRRLSDMPGMILRAMRVCGVDEGKRGEVLRRILDEMVGLM